LAVVSLAAGRLLQEDDIRFTDFNTYSFNRSSGLWSIRGVMAGFFDQRARSASISIKTAGTEHSLWTDGTTPSGY
jgi:hypothetical protein